MRVRSLLVAVFFSKENERVLTVAHLEGAKFCTLHFLCVQNFIYFETATNLGQRFAISNIFLNMYMCKLSIYQF